MRWFAETGVFGSRFHFFKKLAENMTRFLDSVGIIWYNNPISFLAAFG
jgi:hypothetical protein